MSLVKKYPILGSSANPDKLSLSIKGAAVYLIPIVVLIAKASGFEVAEADLIGLVNSIALVVASVVTAIGLARKIYNKIKK